MNMNDEAIMSNSLFSLCMDFLFYTNCWIKTNWLLKNDRIGGEFDVALTKPKLIESLAVKIEVVLKVTEFAFCIVLIANSVFVVQFVMIARCKFELLEKVAIILMP